MELFRIHAFAVIPQKTADEKSPPSGGAYPVNAEIRAALEKLFVSSKLASQAIVDFRVDGNTDLQHRRNVVRGLVMEFVAGTAVKAKAAARSLAARLSESMDERSPPTLLMLTASRNGSDCRMTMWAFPQDEAFQFRPSRSGAKIRLLSDIFSRSSRLRKAALFEGRQRQTDFWSGRMLDLQSTGGFGKAADYWITAFLDCRFGLEGEAGTRLLVDSLKSTYDSYREEEGREQLHSAMVAIRTSPKRTWSLNQFATQYLQGEVKEAFLWSVPADMRNLSFKFQRDVFEKKLNFRVFRLKDDIFVSAPFGMVGDDKPVRVSHGEQPTLRCEGPVISEQVRARHG